ncbi:MAG TPA: ABC transporter substrate-binding protein [Longimicrobiales bacterium]
MMKPARDFALLLCALAPLLTSGCSASDAEPIYLGLAGPLEKPNGRSFRLAAEMAVEEINRAGGIRGRPLALVVKDDEANSNRAIDVATELRDNPGVVAVIGHVNSAQTLAAAKIYNDERNGVVAITPASTSPLIAAAGPWTFRVCPSELHHGAALARWIYGKLGRRRAGILYANDGYGRGVHDSFIPAFVREGGEIVADDPYLPALYEDDRALDPYLERAIRNRMDALVIAGQSAEALKILRAARRLGYTGPVFASEAATDLKDAGPIAEGVYIPSAFVPDRHTTAAQQFVKAYIDRYRELPDSRGAMAYDAVYLLKHVIEEVGTDRRKIRDRLAAIGRGAPAYEGVTGTIAFDENGDAVGKEVTIGVVENGRLVTARS